jgi:spermidine dehydrogenase
VTDDDDPLGMTRAITRRDFLDGIAIGAASLLVPACKRDGGSRPFAPERDPSYYPPGRVGMRGSHPGSFEVAHQLRDGTWRQIGEPEPTGEHFDLVVVGAGISGLAAAHFYRQARGDAPSILLVDNHDDVGGHAKRNEVDVDGHVLVSYGGTESIEFPLEYSDVAKRVLADIGIDLARFPAEFPRVDRAALGLGAATFFDAATFGSDRLMKRGADDWTVPDLEHAPLADAVRASIARLRTPTDYWPTLSSAEKKARLAKLSYRSFLLDVAKVAPGTIALLQTGTHSLYGVGIDAVPALDCWALGFPGFDGLHLDPKEPSPGLGRTPQLEMHDDPNVQFPDGNATVARLLVRRLIPSALPGTTMQDAVAARLDYARLDEPVARTRIRLNTTAVNVRHVDGDRAVELAYVRGGRAWSVRANACVLACWNGVIPYLAPELPEPQRRALAYGVKVPLVYANVAIRSWRAFHELGVDTIAIPAGYFTSAHLELHEPAARPDQPAFVKLVRTPCAPGLPAREQHRRGRGELLATPLSTFERELRDLLRRVLGPGGFDPARDIAAIIVNRWSHGYAYEYNSLWDEAWPPGREPCVIGRARFKQLVIANADAGAYAYTDGAIDQARRAIDELLG